MKIVSDKITINELKEMAGKNYSHMVKAVVDIEKEVMAVDADLHADQERLLLESGSKQENLWGINIYPSLPENERIEFDSMINVRPAQENYTRGVADPVIRNKIIKIIRKLVKQ